MSKTVAIVINDISASGGTERIATFLSNQLSSLGNQVTLVSILKNGEPFYKLTSNVHISYVDSSSLLKLGCHLRRLKSDIVISISMGRLSFKLALLKKAQFIKSKLILSEHTSFESSSKNIRFMKLLSYRLADELVLLTKHDYDILKSRTTTPVTVIPNPTLYPTMPISEISEKKKIILAVGRLSQQKSFARLIYIWSYLPEVLRQHWILKIVGDGEEKEMLTQLACQLSVSDSISFEPASPQIDAEYKAASILAMTSRYEGLPLVLIEAKSFGLPAVAFDCKTGPREIINEGVDGFLVLDGDMEAYKDKLVYLMNSDDARRNMQLAALSAAERYSPEIIVKQWMRLI